MAAGTDTALDVLAVDACDVVARLLNDAERRRSRHDRAVRRRFVGLQWNERDPVSAWSTTAHVRPNGETGATTQRLGRSRRSAPR